MYVSLFHHNMKSTLLSLRLLKNQNTFIRNMTKLFITLTFMDEVVRWRSRGKVLTQEGAGPGKKKEIIY